MELYDGKKQLTLLTYLHLWSSHSHSLDGVCPDGLDHVPKPLGLDIRHLLSLVDLQSVLLPDVLGLGLAGVGQALQLRFLGKEKSGGKMFSIFRGSF